MFISDEDNERCGHADLRHGFAITFPDTEPDIDIQELEKKVNDIIAQDLPITYVDENHIRIGDNVQPCTGPRLHVSRTGMIKDFHLLYRFIHDPRENKYMLIGCVGERNLDYIRKLNPEQFSDTVRDLAIKERALAEAIKTMLGINPKVHLVAPKTITRSEGKAVRVIDKRKLHG